MTPSTGISFIATLDLDRSYVKMGRFLVYALIDPRTNGVRYVGRSCKGIRRARSSAREDVGHKGNWTRELREKGLTPLIGILEECSSKDEVIAREVHWISEFRKIASLTNLTDGGNDQTPFPQGSQNPCHKNNIRFKAAKACYDPIRAAEEGRRRWQDPKYREVVTKANRTRMRGLKQRLEASVRSKEYYRTHRPTGCRPVVAIGENGERKVFLSIHDAARALGGSVANISQVLTGRDTSGKRRFRVAGYKFEYAQPASTEVSGAA